MMWIVKEDWAIIGFEARAKADFPIATPLETAFVNYRTVFEISCLPEEPQERRVRALPWEVSRFPIQERKKMSILEYTKFSTRYLRVLYWFVAQTWCGGTLVILSWCWGNVAPKNCGVCRGRWYIVNELTKGMSLHVEMWMADNGQEQLTRVYF